MRRFAQIQDGRAHWVFEADAPPECHPSIVFVDVTGTKVAEGWRYDGERFIAPPPARSPSTVSPAARDPGTHPAVVPYHLTPAAPLAMHEHDVMHYLVVARGTVRVVVGSDEYQMAAPDVRELPPKIPHGAFAVTEQADVLSVFPDRF